MIGRAPALEGLQPDLMAPIRLSFEERLDFGAVVSVCGAVPEVSFGRFPVRRAARGCPEDREDSMPQKQSTTIIEGRSDPSVAAIEAMDRAGLVALWRELYDTKPPKNLSQPFLRRSLAFETQARAQGGLPTGFAAKLSRAVAENKPKPSAALRPGGRLLREWNGVTHVVDVTEQGFRWREQNWRSLSVIAREITGAHWSGPRFFGLNGGAGR